VTSRRSMQTYSERMSRAMQFVPGHVGGRVASAQPIRRRGGNLRTPSVGAVAAPSCFTIRPDAIATAIESDFAPTYTGGAGNATFGDQSDSTYVTLTNVSGSPNTMSQVVATFAATALPDGFTVGTVTFGFRMRRLGTDTWQVPLLFDVAENITGTNTYSPYIGNDGSFWYDPDEAAFANLTTTYGSDTGSWTTPPTVGEIEAGTVQMLLTPYRQGGDASGDKVLEIADIWMIVCPA